MKKILAGMVAPEKSGIRGSMWMTLLGDSMVIQNQREHLARVGDLRLQGYEIVYVENDIAATMVRSLIT